VAAGRLSHGRNPVARPAAASYGRVVVSGFHHITLRVTDLERSRRFYQALPGFVIDQDFPGEKVRFRIGDAAMVTFRDPDNIQWEFFEEA
jgi:catechol-2,3-dioxygenase